mmetsp:Transcript_36244/g.114347  ORF Transcript_36244/g.114347 Transcript_36244/m.114347 type:complete len:516 (-) Transcript_36244:14-1561(-)
MRLFLWARAAALATVVCLFWQADARGGLYARNKRIARLSPQQLGKEAKHNMIEVVDLHKMQNSNHPKRRYTHVRTTTIKKQGGRQIGGFRHEREQRRERLWRDGEMMRPKVPARPPDMRPHLPHLDWLDEDKCRGFHKDIAMQDEAAEYRPGSFCFAPDAGKKFRRGRAFKRMATVEDAWFVPRPEKCMLATAFGMMAGTVERNVPILINHKFKFLYVLNYGGGAEEVEPMLRASFDGTSAATSLELALPEDPYQGYYIFTTTRNPMEKIVHAYLLWQDKFDRGPRNENMRARCRTGLYDVYTDTERNTRGGEEVLFKGSWRDPEKCEDALMTANFDSLVGDEPRLRSFAQSLYTKGELFPGAEAGLSNTFYLSGTYSNGNPLLYQKVYRADALDLESVFRDVREFARDRHEVRGTQHMQYTAGQQPASRPGHVVASLLEALRREDSQGTAYETCKYFAHDIACLAPMGYSNQACVNAPPPPAPHAMTTDEDPFKGFQVEEEEGGRKGKKGRRGV